VAAKWRGLYVDGFGIWFGKPALEEKDKRRDLQPGSIRRAGSEIAADGPMEAMEGETDVKLEDLPPITPLDKIIVAFGGRCSASAGARFCDDCLGSRAARSAKRKALRPWDSGTRFTARSKLASKWATRS